MTKHESAQPNHYDQEASTYDDFNEENSKPFNAYLAKLLNRYDVKTVLDLTCGTGSQVFHLYANGFECVGCDINQKMLDIANHKACELGVDLAFQKGDMRTTKSGTNDAVITIFNAIGHLTQDDFKKALINIKSNLKAGGIYVFDIFNLDYLLHSDNITKLTIDVQKIAGTKKFREIQYSTITTDGVLASYDTYLEQEDSRELITTTAFQTLQVYNVDMLQSLFKETGFEMVECTQMDGKPFDPIQSESMLIVARRL